MKKIFFPLATIATLLFAGCVNEALNDSAASKNDVTVLIAGTPTTKTMLQDDQKVLWTNGDVINVNGVESNALELDNPSATVEFTIPEVLEKPYSAVFPASIYKDAETVTLPAEQVYAEATFAANASPMAAYQEKGNELKFKHLCSVLKLNITKAEDADKVAYIEFFGKNNEKVCGDFSINCEDAALTPVSETKDEDKAIKVNVGCAIPEGGLAVYVVVPAAEYANGYTVRVVDEEGHYLEVSKKSGQTLDAGKIYDMPEFAFVPAGTLADVMITSAAEFVDFATKYNEGKYDSAVSVSLVNDIEFDAKTSAAFNATGGIGAGATFNGMFYGDGHTIKGLEATVALFYKIAGAAVIKDLTLDETSSFTFALTADKIINSNLDISAVVGATSAETNELSNLNVKSDITLSKADVYPSSAFYMNLGAIAGRVYYGTIKGCSYSGKITVPEDFYVGATKPTQVNVGGICGAVTNARGAIYSSEFNGSIDFSAKIKGYTHIIRIAGIVGHFGNDIRTPLNGTSSKNIKNNGTITVAQTANAANSHTYFIAGIVGESLNDVSNAVNNGNIEAKVTGGKTSPVKLAGIVGKLSTGKKVSNCENTGVLTSQSGVVDAFLAETTYEEGKTYDDVVLNCTDTSTAN